MHKFSIVIGFRDRDLPRVKNSLDSLACQTFVDFELIFVDYGSEKSISREIELLLGFYPFARYLFTDTRGWLWNRAHAFNTGIKRAAGEITVIWDIDLIVEPNFLELLSAKNFNEIFTTHRCYYLPKEATLGNFRSPEILSKSQHAYVGLCAVKTSVVKSVQGFDEFFQVWGAEDDDLNKRLEQAGLGRILINADELPVYHQWHESQATPFPSIWYLKMVENLVGLQSHKVGDREYGELISFSDRLVNSFDKEKAYHLNLPFHEGIMVYNGVLQWLAIDNAGDGLYIQQVISNSTVSKIADLFAKVFNKISKIMGLNLRIVNKAIVLEQQKQENIMAFFNYFIGTYRERIADYSYQFVDGKLFFLVIKR